ncbi:MAG: transcriptional repressor [Clostridia bacterium]|nr:transcriptional repressor [Clostridia bacterium]
MKRSTYATAQKQQLLDFLQAHHDQQFTIGALADALRASGFAHGRSTVYRQIGRLCDEGVVRRFAQEGSNTFVYQYIRLHPGCSGESHFHLKCVHCGKLIHLECLHLAEVRGHIQEAHSFRIGSARGILWGECSACMGKGNAHA